MSNKATQKIQLLNSFYQKSICREVVLRLYKNKCQKCGLVISGEWDISHVFPRSKGSEFSMMMGGGLNVDNLINLVPMHQKCNRENGDGVIDNPLLLFNSLNYTQKIVERRLNKIMKTPILEAANKEHQEIIDYLYSVINFNYSFGTWISFSDDEYLSHDFCDTNNLEYEEHPIFNIERIFNINISKSNADDLIINCPKTVKLSNVTNNESAVFFIKKKLIINLYTLVSQLIPLLPNPPDPRLVSDNSSTIPKITQEYCENTN